jgi:hypothetical protein
VIGLVEAVERGPVYAEQRRLPVRGVEPVEIDQQAHHAIIEAMADRLQARVHHLAKVERGGSNPAATRFGFGRLIGHGYSAACASPRSGPRHGAAASRRPHCRQCLSR